MGHECVELKNTSAAVQCYRQVTYYQIIRIFSIFDSKYWPYPPGHLLQIIRIFSIFDSKYWPYPPGDLLSNDKNILYF